MSNLNIWEQDSRLTPAFEAKLNSVFHGFLLKESGKTKKEIEIDVGLIGYKKFIYIGRYANTSEATINITIHPDFCEQIDALVDQGKVKIGSIRKSKLGRMSLSSNYKKFPINKSSTQKIGAKYRVPVNDGLQGFKCLLEHILSSK